MFHNATHLFHKFRRWTRPLHAEKGSETLEWLGMIMVVLALLGSVAIFMGGAGATPVAESMRDTVESWVANLEGGQVDGGTIAAESPFADLTAPALGVPALVGTPSGGGNGDNGGGGGDSGGGGSCGIFQVVCDVGGAVIGGIASGAGWVGEQIGNGFNWAGEQISNGWTAFTNWWNSESANWFKGLLVGLAATLVVVVGLVALVAAAVISVPVAIVAGIVAAVAAIGVGIWYALTQVNGVFGWEHILPAFGLSLGAGIIAAGIVIFIGTGAAAATWAWITRIALPAILNGVRVGWQWAITTVRAGWQWLGQVALPAIRAFIARSWTGLTGFLSGLWARFAATGLGRILIAGFHAMGGWRAAFHWFAWNGALGGIVFAIQVVLGWRTFDFSDPWSYVSFFGFVVQSGVLGVLSKWFLLGAGALGFLGRFPQFLQNLLTALPQYGILPAIKQLATKFILPVVTHIGEVWGWVATGASAALDWFRGWWGGGNNTPTPNLPTPTTGPIPVPGPTPTPVPVPTPPTTIPPTPKPAPTVPPTTTPSPIPPPR